MKSFRLALLGISVCLVSAAEYTVRVETGEHGIENAIVTAPIPESAADFPAAGTLSSAAPAEGGAVLFQQTLLGEITFVLPKMEPRSVQRFSVKRVLPRDAKLVRADLEDGKITVTDLGRKVFVYQGAESEFPRPDIKPIFKRGGYIHPVYSPGGRLITDDYPSNHPHHHGIWFPWTKTSFEGRSPDFWNMGQGKGKVEFVEFGKHWSGPVQAGFQTEHRFIDLTAPEPKAALNESWSVTAFHVPGGKYFVFDLVSTQTCASASPLILPKYYYGGLGFRGNWAWNGAGNTHFLTSEGETDRIKGNETRGNWCHIGGEVNGRFTGIAILSHPDNFRSPQPMRLHPKEPFFCFAPSQLGDWRIEPGKPYVSRYRYIVSDGRPDKDQIDRLWNAYAHPPKVVIETR